MLKVTISYDMLAGREQECQEFLINKFAPTMSRMGFNISEVWFTVWGNSPQVLSGGYIDEMEEAKKIFLSKEWKKMASVMEGLCQNFKVTFVKLPDIDDEEDGDEFEEYFD